MKSASRGTRLTRAETTAATRDRIALCAHVLLFENQYDDVTLVDIADAAGVSHQTVLNHFESKEGVALAVFELVRVDTESARYQARPGDIKGAVKALVTEYDRMGDVNVDWMRSAQRLPRLAAALNVGRESHRGWVEVMLGGGLTQQPAARRRAINSLYAATDVHVWKLLRRDMALSRSETEKIMTDLVFGVLNGPYP